MPTLRGPGAYSKLRRLKEEGLIQMRPVRSPRDVFWVLGPKGFHRIRQALPPLKEAGYLSEYPDHDILVSAIHLGDGVFGPIEGLSYVTEQQLRRLEPHHLPSGIPHCCGHRPDGYWNIDTAQGSKLIALEVELHTKANSDYGSIARFYTDMCQIDRVLWVCLKPSMAKTIHRALTAETEGVGKHDFVPLELVYSSGWNASIIIGPDQGKTIYELLEKTPTKPSKNLFTIYSLDPRISPYISPCSRLFAPEAFSN